MITLDGDFHLFGCAPGANDKLSHDDVFHSVLGLLDVRTSAYLPARDVFARCRGTPSLPAGIPAPGR